MCLRTRFHRGQPSQWPFSASQRVISKLRSHLWLGNHARHRPKSNQLRQIFSFVPRRTFSFMTRYPAMNGWAIVEASPAPLGAAYLWNQNYQPRRVHSTVLSRFNTSPPNLRHFWAKTGQISSKSSSRSSKSFQNSSKTFGNSSKTSSRSSKTF